MWVLRIRQRNDSSKHGLEQRLWYFKILLFSAYLAKCWDAWKVQLDWFLIAMKTIEAMTVQGNIMGLLLDVNFSSAILTPSYQFSRRQRLYGEVMCQKTIKIRMYVKWPTFLPDFYQIWIFLNMFS